MNGPQHCRDANNDYFFIGPFAGRCPLDKIGGSCRFAKCSKPLGAVLTRPVFCSIKRGPCIIKLLGGPVYCNSKCLLAHLDFRFAYLYTTVLHSMELMVEQLDLLFKYDLIVAYYIQHEKDETMYVRKYYVEYEKMFERYMREN